MVLKVCQKFIISLPNVFTDLFGHLLPDQVPKSSRVWGKDYIFENEQSLRDVYNKFLAHQEVHLEVLGYSDRLQTSSFQNYLPDAEQGTRDSGLAKRDLAEFSSLIGTGWSGIGSLVPGIESRRLLTYRTVE